VNGTPRAPTRGGLLLYLHPMPRGRIRSSLAAVVAATTLLLFIPTAGQAQSTTRTACPGTFQVLHNDSIGTLRLSAGAYQITVANPAALSCARAAQDLSEFLQDYDGKLRRPWNVNTRAVAFQRGSDGQVSFSLARVGSATPGGGGSVVPTPTANACPGYFDVLHNDHIGSLAVPKDAYRITLLSPSLLGCASASRLFTSFLQDFDGTLPSPWVLNQTTATFTRRGSNTGFRIKPAVGPEPKPSNGGRYPAPRQHGECPGTFRVLNNDRVAGLSLPAGPYLTFVYRGTGVSCREASQLFRTFLSGQNVPRGYAVAPATGVFSTAKKPIFRVKPQSPRGSTAR